ncbi:MAG: DeoR family transcriptional regulator [Vulcanisaeta sp.]|nr:DeoR family transcriptional regulator [Vulcanisaeta sp.]
MDLTLGEEILILLRERGPLTVEEIASYLRRSVDEVREELKYLELDKLVTRVKKGLIFKKEAYDLTPTGLDEAEKAFEKLRARADEFIRRLKSTNPDEVEEILNQYASLIPLLLLLDLIPLELLMLMGLDVLLLGPIMMHGNQ